jgi:LmbE family N-acetylglucosaminyl deacetylase
MPAVTDAWGEALRVAVVVAHPDDETLWAGGTLLLHPAWQVTIVTLCRGGDADRAPRFARACAALGARGRMADLDDGPAQHPLPPALVQATVRALLEDADFDLVVTHGARGEYTRHRRHEETSRAVAALCRDGVLRPRALWRFAYTDDARATLPHPRPGADHRVVLPDGIFAEKYRLIREIYGFSAESWEARAVPTVEAFTRVDIEDDR